MKSMFKSALGALMVVLALSGLTAASALASGAPTAETKPATVTSETSANLNGVVNPNGAETKYYFEYGTTTSYGLKTKQGLPGSGTLPVEVSKTVGALTPNTTYHFRIVASNSYGTTYGADKELSTKQSYTGLPEFVARGAKELKTMAFKTSVPETLWEKQEGESFWPCSGKNTFNGKFLTSKTVSGTIVFQGCGFNGLGPDSCSSYGAAEGEIKTVELEGTLVYRSKASKTVALLLKPKSGELLVPSFQCRYSGEVRGTILMPLEGPINKPTESIKLKKLQENGEYENSFGSKQKGVLETDWIKGWAPLLWRNARSEEFAMTTNENIEIKA